MIEPAALGLLIILGCWAALDGTSVGQFMISRPLVSGTIAGWILGDPGAGILVGAVLEAAHLGELPIGGARLPEPGPAAVPATALAVAMGGMGGVAAGAALGGAWSLFGGLTVGAQRRANGWFMRRVGEGGIGARQLARRHWGCIALDGLRGAVVTGAGLGVAVGVAERVEASWWTLGPGQTTALVLLPGAVASGALLRSWYVPRRRVTVFLLGLLGGVAMAVVL